MRSALSAETTNLAATIGISTTLDAKIFWVRTCDSVAVRAKAEVTISEAAETRTVFFRRFINKAKYLTLWHE